MTTEEQGCDRDLGRLYDPHMWGPWEHIEEDPWASAYFKRRCNSCDRKERVLDSDGWYNGKNLTTPPYKMKEG